MARCRVVLPETVRLPLSDGDFLTVKKELNAGEYLDLLLSEGATGKSFALTVAYLVGWTLVGIGDVPIAYTQSQPVQERRDILRSLDIATLVELHNAIDAHHAANERAIEEKKRTPSLVGAS